MKTRASTSKASDGVKWRRWHKMSLRPTDLLLPPELRAILIGAPRAGKLHFVNSSWAFLFLAGQVLPRDISQRQLLGLLPEPIGPSHAQARLTQGN